MKDYKEKNMGGIKDILRAVSFWALGAVSIMVVYAVLGLVMREPLWIVSVLDIPSDGTMAANAMTVVIVISFTFCYFGAVVYRHICGIIDKMSGYFEEQRKVDAFARMEIKENNRFMGIKYSLDMDGNEFKVPYYGSQVMYLMNNSGKVFPRVITARTGLMEDIDYLNYPYEMVERIDVDMAKELVDDLVKGGISTNRKSAASYMLDIYRKLPMLDMAGEAETFLEQLTKT